MKQTTDFKSMKNDNEKITMITAYDYPSAKLAEQAGIDMILVGDSLGMVMLGYDSTVQVTLNDMIHHTKAVKEEQKYVYRNGHAFCNLSFSKDETLKNAARLMQEAGCHAIKVEGLTMF